MIRRREFITLLGGAAVTWPLAVRAQQRDRVKRIGVLDSQAADDPEAQLRRSTFEQRLQQLGWSLGRGVQIDYRWGGNADDIRRQSLAKELVALQPEVIL